MSIIGEIKDEEIYDLKEKIRDFRAKLQKCVDEHSEIVALETTIWTEAEGWLKEFDNHFGKI